MYFDVGWLVYVNWWIKLFLFFSSPEHEVLGVSYCDRLPSGVRMYVRSQFQTSSPKPLGQFQPNWRFSIPRSGEKSLLKQFWSVTKMAATPIYGKNLKKSSCQIPLVRYQNNFTCMFLEGQYLKFDKKKNMAARGSWTLYEFAFAL